MNDELWKYQPAVRKMVNRTLGPHRRHHREDLEMHCYAELTARFHQYKGEGAVWAWAKKVLTGVLADWLEETTKREKVVAESHGGDPNALPAPEKMWTEDGFEDVPPTIVRPEQPKGAPPDSDDSEGLTEWAQGDIKFNYGTDDDAVEAEPESEAGSPDPEPDEPVEVPPTMTRIQCFECAQVRTVVQQIDRIEGTNKVSTLTLACGHSREQVKKLKAKWKRKSRATGKPRGRPRTINAAVTL
jgi:hypothetical protein